MIALSCLYMCVYVYGVCVCVCVLYFRIIVNWQRNKER